MNAAKVKGGRASGAARRALVADRDRALALARTAKPGIPMRTYAEDFGLTRNGAYAAIARALADPAVKAECEAIDRARRIRTRGRGGKPRT